MIDQLKLLEGRHLYQRLNDMYLPHPLANMKTLLILTVIVF